MLRVAFKFAYIGTDFHGLQYQPKIRTVEGEIRKALEKNQITFKNLKFSGRTDSGVHALGNVFSVDVKKFNLSLVRALNHSLPDDISIWGYRIVENTFHPRKMAKKRIYRYILLEEDYDIKEMEKALKMIEGVHDFKFFVRGKKSCVREIYNTKIEKKDRFIFIDIEGNAFCWNMVRNIVSALKVVGITSDSGYMMRILNGEDTVNPSSPHGLILIDVVYDFDFNVDEFGIKKLKRMSKTRKEFYGQLYSVMDIFYEFSSLFS